MENAEDKVDELIIEVADLRNTCPEIILNSIRSSHKRKITEMQDITDTYKSKLSAEENVQGSVSTSIAIEKMKASLWYQHRSSLAADLQKLKASYDDIRTYERQCGGHAT